MSTVESEWRRIAGKIEELSRLDRQHLAFGARTHRYRFGGHVAEAALEKVERRLGAPLPLELRAFYRTLGDGGAGPYYGLFSSATLRGVHPKRPFVGVDALRERYARGRQDGYFEAPLGALSGLVTMADEGCGGRTCLVTAGASSGVVHISADNAVVAGAPSLVVHYDRWLGHELASFRAVRAAMESTMTYDEIATLLSGKFDRWDAGSLIASIADVPRPADLFGTPPVEVHHGASQVPWYREVLGNWRGANGISAAPPPVSRPIASERVTHPKFGEGVVLAREHEGDDAKVEVRFADGVRKLQARFLKRLA